jgi:hypothetical protein
MRTRTTLNRGFTIVVIYVSIKFSFWNHGINFMVITEAHVIYGHDGGRTSNVNPSRHKF